MQSPQHISSNSNSQSNSSLERPATAFLSYKREDAEQVKSLQLHLKVRGVRAWRDVTDIPLGGFTEHAIIQAIKQESDAFVIYITPACLQSDYIWDKEVPAALQRWEQDHAFNIVPILQGVTFDQVQQNSTVRGYSSLTEFNAVSLPDPNQDIALYNQKLREISQRILKATYALRLRRIGADSTYEPYIVLRAVDYVPPVSSLDLDLDWVELFTSKKEPPPEKVWYELLLPALEDVKRVLSAQIPSHKLHIDVQAYLPAPFTLGHAIPETSRFTLLLEGQNETWSTKGTTTDPTPLQKQSYSGHGDPKTAIVVITERNIAQDVARNIPILGISYKQHLHFSLPGRIDSASQALAISHQIRLEFRDLCDKGVTHIHLFAALPAALAVMIGYQFNALCPITLYYYKQAEGHYIPVCTLDKP
jgi:SMODS-associated and fused to various effectors sensor domain/TIR domain